MKEFKQFFKDLSLVAILVFAIYSPILFFNTVIDPYGIFFNAYKDLNFEPNNHYQKVKYLIENPTKYDSYIFGSSRVNYLDPRKIPRHKYYNMTYASGLPKSHYEDLLVMLKHGVTIKHLLIGIDYMSMIENPPILENDLLRKKYPNTFIDKVLFYKHYLFNMPGWDFVKLTMERGLINRSLVQDYGITSIPSMDKSIETDPQFHLGKESLQVPISYVPDHLNIAENISEINKIIELCKKNNIDFEIFINPAQTATYLNMDFNLYFEALKLLSSITDYYDFSGLSSAVTDQTNFYESSHFRSPIGDLIIAEIFKTSDTAQLPSDFGLYVTPLNMIQNINRHLQLLKEYNYALSPSRHNIQPEINANLTILPDSLLSFKLKTLNKKKFLHSDKAIILTTPAIYLSGETEYTKHFGKASSNFLQVGEKYFAVHLNNESTNTHDITNSPKQYYLWETIIPKSLLNSGLQKVRWAVYDSIHQKMIVSEKSISWDVVKAFKPVLFENLNVSNDKIIYSVDLINGSPVSQFTTINQEQTLQIVGWSFNERERMPNSSVIFYLNGKYYRSQYLIKRDDLVSIYNNPNLIYAGWGATIPIDDLSDGEHTLEIRFVNSDTSLISEEVVTYDFTKNQMQAVKMDDSLKELSEQTDYSIDVMNGIEIMNYKERIIIQGSNLHITGWAADKKYQKEAEDVLLKIDHSYYRVTARTTRPDVAKVFNNPDYIHTGWEFKIPTSIIGEGKHELEIKIISNDKKSFYSGSQIIQFIIE